ncbi:MAG: LysE family transporter [Chloroflexota bacterium]|nr:LysE family transporter [Chloroflexota bacterium]
MPEATLIIIFTTSFGIALTGAMMPGPVLALTISGAAQRGFWAGPLIVLGHAILELLLVIALIFGLSQFIESEFVASIIGIIGGMVLVGIGVMTVLRGRHRDVSMMEGGLNMKRSRILVLSGIVGSVSNPYWFLWWATIGITYLLWSLELGTVGVATFFTGHILGDLSWYALVAFAISSGKRFISDSAYRWMLIVCGVALIGLGIYFIVSGGRFLA